ncbi:MCE family protein [Mycobacterium sp. SP-6446]|uniref:MCE family protein n=1 Tax=Mycobacterium sp. SP-6446 TaxID=1834162 RepID=UPI00096E84B1|nr:MCE family protein [Mycobacterium sp. SP-6446]OMC15742.1 mammalian cell entry protein [Mycobacterium sp. SP-6446]
MLKYGGSHLIRPGFIGIVLVALIIAVGLQPGRLLSLATSVRYQALFSEAGGLEVGNDVTTSGIKVGTVSDIALRDGEALVTFTVKGKVRLGSDSTAHIRTGSLLGQRVLTLQSAGARRLRPSDLIPLSRTSSPYSLTESVSDLTTNLAGTDTASLNQSLDTLSATIDRVAPQLGPMFDGLTHLSESLNGRNQTLGEVLKSTSTVTGILSQRSQQMNTLILNANALLGVLAQRRQAIVELLANTSAVAKQLSGLVHDNEQTLAPTLQRLNSVTAILEKNRDNISKALPGLAKFEITQGEAVSSGFYYQAYDPNVMPPQFVQPFLDYLWGFRRGNIPGQPPDNAGPRALFPFPYNGIPQHQGPR